MGAEFKLQGKILCNAVSCLRACLGSWGLLFWNKNNNKAHGLSKEAKYHSCFWGCMGHSEPWSLDPPPPVLSDVTNLGVSSLGVAHGPLFCFTVGVAPSEECNEREEWILIQAQTWDQRICHLKPCPFHARLFFPNTPMAEPNCSHLASWPRSCFSELFLWNRSAPRRWRTQPELAPSVSRTNGLALPNIGPSRIPPLL